MTNTTKIHDGVSITTQDPGTLIVSARPDHLGGGVYIGTRKKTADHIVQARQYIALDRAGASMLLADLASLLDMPEDKPWEPRKGDAVRSTSKTYKVGQAGVVSCVAKGLPYPVYVVLDGSTTAEPFRIDELAPRRLTVGDRVRCVEPGGYYGRTGVIMTHDNSTSPYRVRFDDAGRGLAWMLAHEVEPLS